MCIPILFLSVRVSELVSYATSREHVQCATGNPVPVDPVDFFRYGSVPAKYRPDLTS